MELVPVVVLTLAAVIAAAVCMHRATLGSRMDQSLEQMKSHSGVLAARDEGMSVAPMPRVAAKTPTVSGRAQVGRPERVPAAAMVAHHLQSSVPKAS
jgi:hypothetical protein